ncbi:MAG: hypothetical protein Q7R33_09505 [Nitrosarchaeum sp.]|nr:hypothetical protein [Nitrosarchaeum sp.]
MIDDPIEHAEYVKTFSCWQCAKDLSPTGTLLFEFKYCRSESDTFTSFDCLTSGIRVGSGAYIRICVECFSSIAGPDYLFDPKVWK